MMLRRGLWCELFVSAALLVNAGCAPRNVTLASTFPPGSVAAPWILDQGVWSGSFAEAAAALGEDADEWGAFDPQRVWLAVYRHQRQPQHTLTVRAFAMKTRDAARQAFEHFRPADATEFDAGDRGCWTNIGVLFVWGRLVFDIFTSEASWHSEVQAARVQGYIQKRMPPGLPDDPR